MADNISQSTKSAPKIRPSTPTQHQVDDLGVSTHFLVPYDSRFKLESSDRRAQVPALRLALRLASLAACLAILVTIAFVLWPGAIRADGPVPLPRNPDWRSAYSFRIDAGAWGDLDGDGDLDLASSGLTRIQIFINKGLDDHGNLIMAPAAEYGGGDYTSVALGDVNTDGHLDLAVGGFGKALVYLNDGAGSLETTAAWASTNQGHDVFVTWGDMDGDGRLDLAVGNSLERDQVAFPDYVYKNETPPGGPIKLTPTWTNTGVYSQATQSMGWGDVDRDGDLDLAVAGLNEWHLFRNNEGVLEPTPAWTETGSVNCDVAWGDMDGQGLLELAVKSNDEVRVYTFTKELEAQQFWSAEYDGKGSVRWGDVDNDGDLDLAVDREHDTNLVFANSNGTLRTYRAWESDSQSKTFSTEWVDVDGDGDLDLTSIGNGLATLFLNRGGVLPRTPNAASEALTSTSFALAWGDIDGDGQLELAVGAAENSRGFENGKLPWSSNWKSAPNFIYRFKEDNGEFKLVKDSEAWRPSQDNATLSLAWGDVNNDGHLDLAVGNQPFVEKTEGDTPKVSPGWNEIYLNQMDGTLAATSVLTLGNSNEKTTALAWGDANGDGRLDLAFGNATDAKSISTKPDVILYLNQGLVEPLSVPEQLVTIELNQTSRALAPANFYAMPTINSSHIIPITYNPVQCHRRPTSLCALLLLSGRRREVATGHQHRHS